MGAYNFAVVSSLCDGKNRRAVYSVHRTLAAAQKAAAKLGDYAFAVSGTTWGRGEKWVWGDVRLIAHFPDGETFTIPA